MRNITGPPTFRCTSDASPSMAVLKMRWNSSMPAHYQTRQQNHKSQMAMANSFTRFLLASDNIHTFNTLHSYGYTNVYELGPLLNIRNAKLRFEGTAAP